MKNLCRFFFRWPNSVRLQFVKHKLYITCNILTEACCTYFCSVLFFIFWQFWQLSFSQSFATVKHYFLLLTDVFLKSEIRASYYQYCFSVRYKIISFFMLLCWFEGGKQTVAVSLMFLLLELDIDVLKVLVTGLNLSGKMQ